MRTRPGTCQRKARYSSEAAALEVAARASFPLRPYRCGLCRQFHLTSRTKGMKVPLFEREQRAVKSSPSRSDREDLSGQSVVKIAPKSLPPLPASTKAS
ncbi:hypothetical protein [Novosphingobium sp. AP12]|uniref:hypothetical protein n=1 Tax=Novosphingobium sp. AP12 TaxID=1144305 RepID=UPI0002721F33|nr:hypothetical protein [Novosphingobium sp. AP12]EJL24792.1 hypothetical protein PMI02_03467 [Novosphingobium sp. AP12]